MGGAGETGALKSDREEHFSTGSSSAGAAAPGSSAGPGTHEGDVSPQWGSARASLGQRDVSHFQTSLWGYFPQKQFVSSLNTDGDGRGCAAGGRKRKVLLSLGGWR